MFVAQDSVFKISSRWSFCYSYQVVEMARNKPCLAKYLGNTKINHSVLLAPTFIIWNQVQTFAELQTRFGVIFECQTKLSSGREEETLNTPIFWSGLSKKLNS